MRHRWLYHATGLPGWMRFGYSPGWAGRSATGLGPCAEYLRAGKWPTSKMGGGFWDRQWAGAASAPEMELRVLRAQSEAMKDQLDAISTRIEELESELKID